MIVKALILVLSLSLGLLGIGYLTGDLNRVFEHFSPTIIDPEFPKGIGPQESSFKIVAIDSEAGMDSIVVRTISGARRKDIAQKKCNGEVSCALEVKLSSEILGTSKGSAALEVVAFDRSYFSNRTSKEFSVLIDTQIPLVDIVSSQHNLREGGSQLAVYQARDLNLSKSGVRSGNTLYLGSSAEHCSDKLPSNRGLFCAIFSRSRFDDTPVLFALDKVGNIGESGFYNKFFKRRELPVRASVSESWVSKAAPNCGQDSKCVKETIASGWSEALDGIFKGKAKVLTQHPQLEMTPWERPKGTFVGLFGSKQLLTANSLPVGERALEGYEITGTSEVASAQRGTVVSVGRFGPLGLAVMIHHGLNLYSLYGYLSESTVSVGQLVEKGGKIGIPGSTGLGRVEGYYISALLDGKVAVDPNEWWSVDWLSTHITGKIAEASKLAATLPSTPTYSEGKIN